MAQPTQLFTTGDPANGYVVIDNTSSPTFPTLNAGSHIGYDTICGPSPVFGGANSQDKNAFTNGTIPDAVNRSKSFTTSTASVFQIVKYLNPA